MEHSPVITTPTVAVVHTENNQSQTNHFCEAPSDATNLALLMFCKACSDHAEVSATIFELVAAMQKSRDPFQVLASTEKIETIRVMLNLGHVKELLARFLADTDVFECPRSLSIHGWPKVLERLITEAQDEIEKGKWITVLLNPEKHDAFKNVLRPGHMYLWSSMFVHYTVLHRNLMPDKFTRSNQHNVQITAKHRIFRDWLVFPETISRWMIAAKFVCEESYIAFRDYYYRPWDANDITPNGMNWKILDEHFADVMQAEKLRKEAEVTRKREEQEAKEKQLRQAEQELVDKMTTPVMLSVQPQANATSVHGLSNTVYVSKDMTIADKSKSLPLSPYVMVNDRFLYSVEKIMVEGSTGEKYKSMKDTIFMNSPQRSLVHSPSIPYSFLEKEKLKVSRLSNTQLEKLVCDAGSITITLTQAPGTGWPMTVVRSVLANRLQNMIFMKDQPMFMKLEGNSVAYVYATATFSDDGKSELGRKIVKTSVIDMVVAKGEKISLVYEEPLSTFA